jgi:CRP-like cAMP-binding protein
MFGEGTFLGGLAAPDVEAFVRTLRRHPFARGETVLHEGMHADNVMVVLRGRVKLVTRSTSGQAALLGLRGPGELLGELSALDGHPRSAEAVALEDGEAGFMTATALRKWVHDHPPVSMALMLTLVARLREADRRRLSLATGNAAGRVARCLLDLAPAFGKETRDGVWIEVPITQEELGHWAGLSRQAVARALDELRSAGWVSSHRQRVVVQDLEALRRVADE